MPDYEFLWPGYSWHLAFSGIFYEASFLQNIQYTTFEPPKKLFVNLESSRLSLFKYSLLSLE